MKKYETDAIDLLYDAAILTPYKYRVKIVSGIIFDKKLICISTNEYKSHPFQKKFSKNDDSIFLHAEIAAGITAIRRIGVENMKSVSLIILRLKKNHSKEFELAMACPCEGCKKFINHLKIPKVIYSNDFNSFNVMEKGD